MSYLKHGDEVPAKGRGAKLSGKMIKFVEAYCNGDSPGFQNASKSVLIAGYKTTNQNRIGTELLQHPLIKEAIREAMESRRERMELSADYVLNKLMVLAEQTEKDSDRLRALELLGKTMALFKERQEVSGPDGDAIRYEQKVREDVADFTRAITRLSERNRKAGVVAVPDAGANG